MSLEEPFVYTALPARVVFGRGTVHSLKDEIERVGCKRALLLSTPEQASALDGIAEILGSKAIGRFPQATMHTPTDVTALAVKAVKDLDADCIVAFGGGSSIGLSKAIALRTELPQIAIPTTYAGSEVTPIIGETEGARKTTNRTPKVLPQIVIYDVDFTLTLPTRLTVTSGTNAIAHAVEALYARNRNPVISMIAEQGIGAMGRALPAIALDPLDVRSRIDAFYGAWLCGTCLGAVEMALHHKICHVIGGAFNLPHAEIHAVILPYALAYNSDAVPEADEAIARALNGKSGTQALLELSNTLGSPQSLRSVGMSATDIELATDLVMESTFWNPRQIERDPIRELIANAWNGSLSSSQ